MKKKSKHKYIIILIDFKNISAVLRINKEGISIFSHLKGVHLNYRCHHEADPAEFIVNHLHMNLENLSNVRQMIK